MTEPRRLRSFFQRLFGIPATGRPHHPDCWRYAEGELVVDLDKATELARRGSGLRFEGSGLPRRVLVVHGEDGGFRAFHNRCTHLGHRRVDPVPGTRTLQCCSVGASTYTEDGTRIGGPAPGPIDTFPTEQRGRQLFVRLS